jgi:aspartyl-tRNA(Asn)/glutamyl-tRNA(Gln) amidotransferase subunit C
MEVNRELIEEVAAVARLKLTDEEINKFIPQLKEIMEYFSMLSEIDTEGIEPSFQPIRLRNRLREDSPRECISQEEALRNSSQNKDGYFKGPKAV